MSYNQPDYWLRGTYNVGPPDITLTVQGGGTMRLAVPAAANLAPSVFGADVVGKYISVLGAVDADNDGHFPITGYDSGSGLWVEFTNASGAAEVTKLLWEIHAASTPYDWIRKNQYSIAQIPTHYRWAHTDPLLSGNGLANHGSFCQRFECDAKTAQMFYVVNDRNFFDPNAISLRMCVRGTDTVHHGLPHLVARSAYTFPSVSQIGAGYVMGLAVENDRIYIGNRITCNPISYELYFGNKWLTGTASGGSYVSGPAISSPGDNDWHALRLDVMTQGAHVRLMAYYMQGYATVDQLFATAPWTLVANILDVDGGATDVSDMPAGYTLSNPAAFTSSPQLSGFSGFVAPGWSPLNTGNYYAESFVAKRMP